MKDTISQLLEAFPPQIIRLLAREGKGRGAKRLTHQDVAKRSGAEAASPVMPITPESPWMIWS